MRTSPSALPRFRTTGTAKRLGAAALATALLLVVAGCGGNEPKWYGADGKATSETPAEPPINVAVTSPAEGAADVSAAAEISYTTDAATSTVELTDAAGTKIDGAMRSDKSTWVPAKMLNWGTQYTAKVTGTSASGKSESKTVTFTTVAKPKSLGKATTVIGDNQTLGVGMPIILSFSNDVAKDQRAAVQKRLFVTSEPAQEGIWHWWSNKEVHFRPKEHWQPGTKLTVRAAIGGVHLGNNRYGSQDLTINTKIGSRIVMEADNNTKQMTVTKDGQLLRTIPVSFGKSSTPSASGNFIIMVKNPWEWFDSSSFGVPVDSADGYRTKVFWPQRITWSGLYIHSAPWSEGDQGRRNVSHGCTNISAANAEWLYKITQIGDPVIVKNTEEKVTWGDGWTDWSRPWEEYVKGSAIPHGSPDAAPSLATPGAAPSASASGSASAGASPSASN